MKIFACILLITLSCSQAAPKPGVERLELVLDWNPSNCWPFLKSTCLVAPLEAFTISELRPRPNSEKICGVKPSSAIDVTTQIDADVKRSLDCAWMDSEAPDRNNAPLWNGVWTSEGFCAGFTAPEYFRFITETYPKYNPNTVMTQFGVKPPSVDGPTFKSQLSEAFKAQVRLECLAGTSTLINVVVCFNATGSPAVNCPAAEEATLNCPAAGALDLPTTDTKPPTVRVGDGCMGFVRPYYESIAPPQPPLPPTNTTPPEPPVVQPNDTQINPPPPPPLAQATDIDHLEMIFDWNAQWCAPEYVGSSSCTVNPFEGFSSSELVASPHNNSKCLSPPPDSAVDVTTQIPADVQKKLKCSWEDLESTTGDSNVLWNSVWSTEGYCTGFSVPDYYSKMAELYQKYNPNKVMATFGVKPPTVDAATFFGQLSQAFGAHVKIDCDPATRLFENIILCLDPAGNTPVDCPEAAQEAACLTGQLNLPTNTLPALERISEQCMAFVQPYYKDDNMANRPQTYTVQKLTVEGVDQVEFTAQQESYKQALSGIAGVPTTWIEVKTSAATRRRALLATTSMQVENSVYTADPADTQTRLDTSVKSGALQMELTELGMTVAGQEPEGGGSSNVAVIVGGVVGGIVAVVAVLAIILVVRKKNDKNNNNSNNGALLLEQQRPTSGIPSPSYSPASTPAYQSADPMFATSPPVAVYGPVGNISARQVQPPPSLPSQPEEFPTMFVDGGSPNSTPITNWNYNSATTQSGGSVPSAPPSPFSQSHSQSQSSARRGSTALAADPLMQYIRSTASMRSTSSGGASRGALEEWQLRFEDIVIERPIGEGSWGRVYRGSWNQTQVAVKILLESSGDAQTNGTQSALMNLESPIMQRLGQEASLMTTLHHPNIVQFLGVTIAPAAVVTEFCSRGSLTSVLQSGKASLERAAELPWSRRVRFAADCVRGMLYLHSRTPPILHRDLKSANLLVTGSWKLKVSDFNLSKVLQETTRSTSLQAMNPRWLAPEVLNGGPASLSSDVFAFGVIMWELLTWELPWGSANPWAIVGQSTSGARLPIPSPNDLPGPDSGSWPQLGRYIALLERCWAQDPGARPTFDEVMNELLQIDSTAAEND